jgi:hypothetical protein
MSQRSKLTGEIRSVRLRRLTGLQSISLHPNTSRRAAARLKWIRRQIRSRLNRWRRLSATTSS